VKTILQRHFPQILVAQVVTMGDSPNDVSLFNAADFGQSVGVANLRRYADQMAHLPRWITMATEGEGFCELLDRLITH
jgi:hydroxymethylpyrimidine pyrophosphatase-like HAD family hydrolase